MDENRHRPVRPGNEIRVACWSPRTAAAQSAVLFFDNYNHLLGGTGVSRGGGFRFVAFENTEGLIGRVVIQDADLNSSSFVVDNLVSQSGRP